VLAAGLAVPAPQVRCTVDDPQLAELSGLVVDGSAIWAMADGGRRVEVDRLDPATCAVVERRTAPIDPYDPEDLARGPGGALWVADIGDNSRARDNVALIVLPAGGGSRLHRMTYPDGPHDAEALLADSEGRPVIVTKDPGGRSGIYRPAAPPEGPGPTPLLKVGEVQLPVSDTVGGPVGSAGGVLVTGAAASADGRVVALRSYTDAWLYRVPEGGDVVDALTGTPVRVPLGGEPQGEAVAFEADGTLVSGSESRGGVKGQIREVRGATGLASAPAPTLLPAGPVADPAAGSAALGAAALIGLLLLGVGAMARRGARRR
jgi:hypothetical protein